MATPPMLVVETIGKPVNRNSEADAIKDSGGSAHLCTCLVWKSCMELSSVCWNANARHRPCAAGTQMLTTTAQGRLSMMVATEVMDSSGDHQEGP